MSETPPPDRNRPENLRLAEPSRPHGCLTAFLVGVIFSGVGLAGFLWLTTLWPDLFGKSLAADLGRALAYGLVLIVPFGLIALLLRQERFTLWRGIALTLALAGGYSVLLGVLLAIDREMAWPGLPDWLPMIVSILYSLAIIAAGHRRFLGRPAVGPLLLGVGLGLLITVAWLVAGALGALPDFLLSLLDAFSTALITAVLLATLFFYDREMLVRNPAASILLAGAAFAALQFGVMVVRGYWMQGNVLTEGMIPAGLIAGTLLTLDGRGGLSRLWWAVLAFFFVAYLVPLALSSGLEGDYSNMSLEMGAAWGPTIPVGLLSSLVIGLLGLSASRWLAKVIAQPAIPALLVMAALALGAILYVGFGRPGMQAETFFVVMADQADTSSARDIADRNERVTAVYQMLTEHALTTQADLRTLLDRRGVRYTPYYLVNGIEIYGDPLLRAQIAARPDVARILNSPHTRPLPGYVPSITLPSEEASPPGLSWGVDKIDAEKVWAMGVTGEGIIVGVADSGVDWTHPALRSQYLGSEGRHDYTWYDAWYGATAPEDRMGHGTHTLGAILGQGGIGVAPGARWIACRNLARDLGNPGYYLDCMQFLFAPFPQGGDPFADGDPTRGAHVVNNSWGCPAQEGCDATTLSIGLDHLRDAGQMYVVSAGNEGPACSTVGSPALADGAFSVGAIDSTGSITGFSSRGPVLADGSGRVKPDVSAPGLDILSSVPGGYASVSGTSMAGPHVAGLVALLWSANPSLIGDVDRTRQIIESTAHHVAAPNLCGGEVNGENNVYGYGWVDALAAVKMALGQQ